MEDASIPSQKVKSMPLWDFSIWELKQKKKKMCFICIFFSKKEKKKDLVQALLPCPS